MHLLLHNVVRQQYKVLEEMSNNAFVEVLYFETTGILPFFEKVSI